MDEQTWTPDGELPERLAAVLDAARRPGDARELAGETAARAEFRDHYRMHPLRRRPGSVSKRLPVKAAVAAVGALSVVGVAAAATDNLPGSLGGVGPGAAARSVAVAPDGAGTPDRAARLGLCEAARGTATAERGPAEKALAALAGRADRVAAYCAVVAAGTRGGPLPYAGRDPAGTGLCRAWAAGHGGERGGKAVAVAFAALASAAGGRDRVDAYCAGSGTARRPADPSHPVTAVSTPRSRHDPAGTPSHPAGPKGTTAGGGPAGPPTPVPSTPPGRGRTP
ncbi:MAG: hypothetical protein ACJ73E_17815 [Mycobacteriales bacterium]